MFDVLDGGTIEPIEFSKDQLKPNRSIIVLDENSGKVWLCHGKLRNLVPRRTALRQAQSLKGHGYTSGNSIVGRELHELVEIDGRKVGREDETTKLNDQLMAVLDGSFRNVGNFVYVKEGVGFGSSSKSINAPKKVASVSSASVSSTSASSTASSTASSSASSKPTVKSLPKVEPAPVKPSDAETYSAPPVPAQKKVSSTPSEVSKTPAPAHPPSAAKNDEYLKAIVIMAVMEEFKDVWISRKASGVISLEQMDGKICSYSVNKGKIEFQMGSFSEVNPEVKKRIEDKIAELS